MLVGHVKTDEKLVLSELRKCQEVTFDMDSMGIIHEYCMPFIDASTCLFHIESHPEKSGYSSYCLYRYMCRITTDEEWITINKDCTNDAWDKVSEFHLDELTFETVVMNGFVFVLAGSSFTNRISHSPRVMCYDMSYPGHGPWRNMIPMLNARRNFYTIASPSTNSIYVFGGDGSSGRLWDCEVCQLTMDVDQSTEGTTAPKPCQWRKLFTMDEKQSICSPILHQGKIYFFDIHRNMSVFDTITQSWLGSQSNCPTPSQPYCSSGVSYENHIYIFSERSVEDLDRAYDNDYGDVKCERELFKYCVETNHWSKVSWDFPGSNCRLVRFLGNGNVLFYSVDYDDACQLLPISYWIYHIPNGTWSKLPDAQPV